MELNLAISDNSSFKSANSTSSEESWDFEKDLDKPSFLCGSDCSSIDDNNIDHQNMKSTFHVLASKLNWSKSIPLSEILNFDSSNHCLQEYPFHAEIIGYEIIAAEHKFTAYKIRVKQNERWSTSEMLSWTIFRRYNDFMKLHRAIKDDINLKDIKLPGKSWFGDNFKPHFIGERIVRLQEMIDRLLLFHGNSYVKTFFCIDDPPLVTPHDNSNTYHLIFNSHQETVRELREQLRQKDQLIQVTESLKDILQQKDSEVDFLRSEMETLRKQKDTLMKAFSSSMDDLSGNNSLSLYPPKLMHGSILDERCHSTESVD